MNKQTIFQSEEEIIIVAEHILQVGEYDESPLIKPFKKLLHSYKKILRQLKRAIKLSDKQQARLNELNETLEGENYELVLALGQAFESFVRALSTAVDAKHPLTAGHSDRVTEYSLFLGNSLGLSEDELEVVKYSALLHDIGKIGVPDAVLTKKGRFTEEERLIMNNHSMWTYKIIQNINLPKTLKSIPKVAACHHEKMDGTGYPYGLSDKKIPFISKILAVGDVFDALTSRRDYPKYDGKHDLSYDPMSMDRAFSILKKGTGDHFDPEITEIALKERGCFEDLWKKLYQENVNTQKTDDKFKIRSA